MNKGGKLLICVLMFAMPWRLRCFIYRRLFNYEIATSAYIGRSVVLAERLTLKQGAVIKGFNFINDINDIVLEPFAQIDVRNWITGLSTRYRTNFTFDRDRQCFLKLGEHCRITSFHFLDCTGGIDIGAFSTLAGIGSVLLSHEIDLKESRQRADGIRVGKYCFIGTNCKILMSARLPDFAQLAAGAVLAHQYEESHVIYGGVPAKPIKALSPSCKYFHRESGHVN